MMRMYCTNSRAAVVEAELFSRNDYLASIRGQN
jgi:hypothetical protein